MKPRLVDLRNGRNVNVFEILPPDVTEEMITCYISHNWKELAIFAYGNFLIEGKGVILALWDNGNLNISYSTKSELSGIIDDNCIAMIERYNPETSIIFMLTWKVYKLEDEEYCNSCLNTIMCPDQKSPKDYFMEV